MNEYNPTKETLKGIVIIALGILMVIFTGIYVFWTIYAFVKYGAKPIDEVPAWALRFMFK